MRDLPTQKTLLAQLGIETELIDLLTEELVTAANRLDLEGMKQLLLKLDFMQRIARGEHVEAEE